MFCAYKCMIVRHFANFRRCELLMLADKETIADAHWGAEGS